MSAWLWTLAAEAQTLGSGDPPGFGDAMDRGLIPLFFYVAASVALMGLAAVVAVVFLRWSAPRPGHGV